MLPTRTCHAPYVNLPCELYLIKVLGLRVRKNSISKRKYWSRLACSCYKIKFISNLFIHPIYLGASGEIGRVEGSGSGLAFLNRWNPSTRNIFSRAWTQFVNIERTEWTSKPILIRDTLLYSICVIGKWSCFRSIAIIPHVKGTAPCAWVSPSHNSVETFSISHYMELFTLLSSVFPDSKRIVNALLQTKSFP